MTHPWLLKRLICGVHDHLEEGDRHCKQHPDVNHLDIGGDRQALRETQETMREIIGKGSQLGKQRLTWLPRQEGW